jgi:hypothetical protein
MLSAPPTAEENAVAALFRSARRAPLASAGAAPTSLDCAAVSSSSAVVDGLTFDVGDFGGMLDGEALSEDATAEDVEATMRDLECCAIEGEEEEEDD